MGIVLTPRHITRFAVDTIGIGQNDRIFDPACGTGGFLISAMEAMRTGNADQYNKFRTEGLYGIEQRDDIYGLAIVNMIFRGDGKSHIYDGNCFEHEFWQRDNEIWYSIGDERPDGATKPFSRVFMNPPFKLASNKETEFVDYGLGQIAEGGILFAVLPYVAIEGGTNRVWRQQLLKRHTLLACIKFDTSLFYPVAEATYAIILKSHQPHQPENDVFMGSLFDDNHRPRKSKRLSDYEAVDNVEAMTNNVRRFLLDQPVENIEREQVIVKIDPERNYDFAPEAYLESSQHPISTTFRSIQSETAKLRVKAMSQETTDTLTLDDFGTFPLSDFVDKQKIVEPKTLKDYEEGKIPVVTAQAPDNGIAMWLNIPDEYCFENCITVSSLHNTKPCEAFWHPYQFSALYGKVIVLCPKKELLIDTDAILYLCEAITAKNAWRYHYARSVKFEELTVEVPIRLGIPDFEEMAQIVKRQTSY